MTGSLAGAIEFIRLEETLREFADGERFIYIPNPGNWGDGLIRYATEQFFRRNGFDYIQVNVLDDNLIIEGDLEEIVSAKNINLVYGGGGGFYRRYRMRKTFPTLIERTHRVLVLPNTFAIPAQKLGFRKKDILFRRDHAESRENASSAIFCHDMAFSLGKIFPATQGSGTGFFFRQDAEGVKGLSIPEGNRDISSEGKHYSKMAAFLEAISKFDTIHTNRLHVGIAAAMMWRRVHFYANSYFKNQAVYEASLRLAFPNVTFHQKYDEQ